MPSFDDNAAPFAPPPNSKIGSTICVTVELTVVVVPVTVKLPAIVVSPADNAPVTAKVVSVPTDVIFGCAFVYTVPATSALPTCPETLPPATAYAFNALPTLPVTLAPAIDVSA